ncbi:hypothetical protein [Streptomyces sparsogenes]|uniref:hypothetical protein n=1 Tax=Streptomyces sparsogenes TaxID=67365 RepID=UPI0033E55B85
MDASRSRHDLMLTSALDVTGWAGPDPPAWPLPFADGEEVAFEPGEPVLLALAVVSFPATLWVVMGEHDAVGGGGGRTD